MYCSKDLGYITSENYKFILDRITYVINNPYTIRSNPMDIIKLNEIKQYIYTVFI